MKFNSKEERDQFVLDNRKIVYHIINKKIKEYDVYDYTIKDLESIGYIGLIKAVDDFDENKDACFFTYASIRIYSELSRIYRKPRSGIVYSRKILENKRKVDNMKNIENKTYKEIAKELNLTEEDVIAIACADFSTVRLNAIKTDQSDYPSEYIETITYKNESSIEMTYELYELLNYLKKRDRQILIKSIFYGLSQSEIAAEFDLSQTRVSEIIKQSLEKLRKVA